MAASKMSEQARRLAARLLAAAIPSSAQPSVPQSPAAVSRSFRPVALPPAPLSRAAVCKISTPLEVRTEQPSPAAVSSPFQTLARRAAQHFRAAARSSSHARALDRTGPASTEGACTGEATDPLHCEKIETNGVNDRKGRLELWYFARYARLAASRNCSNRWLRLRRAWWLQPDVIHAAEQRSSVVRDRCG